MPQWRKLHTTNEIDLRVSIYALIDPRDDSVFYVGKTRSSLSHRLHLHKSSTKHGEITPKACRIYEIMRLGEEPLIVLLEVTTMETFQDCERFWIDKYRKLGFPLTNVSGGGGGMP